MDSAAEIGVMPSDCIVFLKFFETTLSWLSIFIWSKVIMGVGRGFEAIAINFAKLIGIGIINL